MSSSETLACVAGVQRGGRGKLNASAKRDRWALVGNERPTSALRALVELPTSAQRSRFALSSRFALAFNFPPPSPLYAGHASYRNNGKTFPHLKFLKQDLHRISNSSFENWGISLELGNITRIFPNFGWGILCHVTRFDQSRASENI